MIAFIWYVCTDKKTIGAENESAAGGDGERFGGYITVLDLGYCGSYKTIHLSKPKTIH